MALFVINQPVKTTVPTVTVDNKFVPGRHRFQLVVENNRGVQSDPVTATVVVSQGVLPHAAGLQGKPLGRAVKKLVPQAGQSIAPQVPSKAQTPKGESTKDKPPGTKPEKTPSKKRTRKKTP